MKPLQTKSPYSMVELLRTSPFFRRGTEGVASQHIKSPQSTLPKAPTFSEKGGSWALIISLCIALFLTTSASAAENTYRLSSGDRIKIIVYGEPDLSLETTLDDRGVINYPFMGEIVIEGLTVKTLERKIHNHLKGDYLIHPNVHVSIESYRPFFVNGQVKHPGAYPYQPGLTLRRAISLAGGYTERASKKNTFVIHQNEPDKRVRVQQSSKINPGDTITVEESFF